MKMKLFPVILLALAGAGLAAKDKKAKKLKFQMVAKEAFLPVSSDDGNLFFDFWVPDGPVSSTTSMKPSSLPRVSQHASSSKASQQVSTSPQVLNTLDSTITSSHHQLSTDGSNENIVPTSVGVVEASTTSAVTTTTNPPSPQPTLSPFPTDEGLVPAESSDQSEEVKTSSSSDLTTTTNSPSPQAHASSIPTDEGLVPDESPDQFTPVRPVTIPDNIITTSPRVTTTTAAARMTEAQTQISSATVAALPPFSPAVSPAGISTASISVIATDLSESTSIASPSSQGTTNPFINFQDTVLNKSPNFDQSDVKNGTNKPASFDAIIYSVIALALILLFTFVFCIYKRVKRGKTEPSDLTGDKSEYARKQSFIFPKTWTESTPSWASTPVEQFTISSSKESNTDIESNPRESITSSGQYSLMLSRISIIKTSPTNRAFETKADDSSLKSTPQIKLINFMKPAIQTPMPVIESPQDLNSPNSGSLSMVHFSPLAVEALEIELDQSTIQSTQNLSDSDESNYIAALASQAAGLRDSIISYESSTRSIAD